MDFNLRDNAIREDNEELVGVAPKRKRRSDKLIATFQDGYTVEWRFAVREAFKEALDIKLTERVVPVLDEEGNHIMVPVLKDEVPVLKANGEPRLKKKTRTELVWTQGEEFNFKTGSVLYDTKLAYELKWSDALRHIKLSVQVVDAIPLATLKFKLYRPIEDFSTIEELETIECTHGNFIEFLKTGTIITNANDTRNLVEEYGG